MIVVDASVLTAALTEDGPRGKVARARLADDTHWVAPSHVLVEVAQAVRGRLLGGKITDARAGEAISALCGVSLELVGVQPLLVRMWELRANVSAYDAGYIAVAETYRIPLVTADGRLARCGAARCAIEVIP